MDCAKDEVKVYDSLYTSVNDDMQTVIAALINSKSPHIKIKLMNIAKQLRRWNRLWIIRYCHNKLFSI